MEDVTPGMTCTVEQAVEWLHTDLGGVEHTLTNWLTPYNLNSNQFSACCSLTYNIGVGDFEESTVFAQIKLGDFASAATAFALWNKVTKKGVKVVSSGLTARRSLEAQLFLTPLVQVVAQA